MRKIILLILLFTYAAKLNAEIKEIKSMNIINSSADEMYPFLSSSEDLMFFSTNKTGKHDFYSVNYQNGKILSTPVLINRSSLFDDVSINSSNDDLCGYLSLNNKTFIFASKNRSGGNGDFDLYSVKNSIGEWKKIKNLTSVLNSKAYDGDPALSPDGKTLYFSSNRTGGNGGFDIWYSEYDVFSDSWGEPKNLKGLNSKGNETAPFLAADGKTLFFASDYATDNYGAADFYYTKLEDKKWSAAVHLPAPINSTANEKSITFSRDGSICMVSSNRNGNYDILAFELEPLYSTPVTLELSAYDSESGNLMPVLFNVHYGGKKILSKKGEKADAVISADIFKGKSYIDLVVSASNPVYPEHNKSVRLYNNQEQSKVPVMMILSDNPSNINLKNINAPYIDGDFEIKSENGKLTNIKAFETSSRNMKPILNYIFFDENSSILPRRYAQTPYIDGNEFDEKMLSNMKNIDAYYQILNIIGFRLKNNPSASITVIGYNANSGKEKNNLKLSEKRASAVAEYLTNTWQIASNRIKINKGNLPKFASSTKTPEGIAENRRVEIESDDESIFNPIFINWKAYKAEPQFARIIVNSLIHKTDAEWNLIIKNKGKIIDEYSGNQSGQQEIFWSISEAVSKLIAAPKSESESKKVKKTEVKKELKEEQKEEKKGFFAKAFSKISESLTVYDEDQDEIDKDIATQKIKTEEKFIDLEFEFSIKDINTGQLFVKYEKVRMEKMSLSEVANPVRLEKYSFISFDFGKTEPNPQHKEILEMLNAALKPEAKIKVTGYSDIIGNEKTNLSFSEKRAKAIAKSINNNNINVDAKGESILLYDNNLPEGRMYSRTVITEIETPFVIPQK